ncbi:hypothetical protein NLG97_g2069 [Lecanicillium saksenae]|uniref:Uncharacterized protein n=1 Tax=Lecanicillium saksenae TaxID=468837 RepID=A0ACC1R3T3_9HYPO|nr:hypothetical protein NLG97_g2069 [Lecanicillium saksenae]
MALDLSFQTATRKQVDRDSFEVRKKLRGAINHDAFYEAQIQLISRRRVAFNSVEWVEYQALFMSINPDVESLLIESHSSIPIHIERSFRKHHVTVKNRLQTARSQIHYSIDLWTTPNRKSLLGICTEYVLRKALLAFPQCRFSQREDSNDGEFEKSVIAPTHKINCLPLQWWCKEEQRLEYIRLHRMAIDIISIPPISGVAESVFSGVRQTISWDRSRLGAWIVEMTELLGNWNKNDLIRALYVVAGEEDEIISHAENGDNDIDVNGDDNFS